MRMGERKNGYITSSSNEFSDNEASPSERRPGEPFTPSERMRCGGNTQSEVEKCFEMGDVTAASCSKPISRWRSAARSDRWEDRCLFWFSVCENGAASEVVVNFMLPYLLCRFINGEITPPSNLTCNTVVLLLNLVSAYLEGFAKSTQLLSQHLWKTNASYRTIYLQAHGFSLGFLNVSSSFPDVGGGASDATLAWGSCFFGLLYISANMHGSMLVYKFGRDAGWQAMQRNWSRVLLFYRIWPYIVRASLIASLLFIIYGPASVGHNLPLDLTDPEVGGIENVRLIYDEYVIHVPAQSAGLMFGIFMSTFGCVVAALSTEFFYEENHRCFARLMANLISTVAVLLVNYVQQDGSPNFMLMKFSNSFCGAFSAFSSTIGDVYDDSYGAPTEVSIMGSLNGGKESNGFALTGAQNFLFHFLLTVIIMALGVYTGPLSAPPILISVDDDHVRGFGTFSHELDSHMWNIMQEA